MFKRLSISLLLMGLAAFSLGAAAFAWFSDSGSADVTITSGTVDLEFRVDVDCDGGSVDGYDTGWEQFDTTPASFPWNNIVPGDNTADCIEVRNAGPNGTMTVYVFHSGFGGDNALRNATLWQYNAEADLDGIDCLPTAPQNDQYDTGRGCELDTIAPGESFVLRVDVSFPDSGGDQNGLQGLAFDFDVTLTGYTG